MLQLKDTPFKHTNGFLEHALTVARFYGFEPYESVAQKARGVRRAPNANPPEAEPSYARRDERMLAATARACASLANTPGSARFISRIVTSAQRGFTPTVSLELHILGMQGAIAEALLITIADAILAEGGVQHRALSINSIGTTDSSNRYVRDVGGFLRKHLETIAPALRTRAVDDPLGTLIQLLERGHPAASRAPQSMEYLTEEERRRFWDLIEYLEVAGMPYELNPHVLGSRDCWSHTLFEISEVQPETNMRVSIVRGGRYDPLATRLSGTPLSGAAAVITCEARGKISAPREVPREVSPFYFAHLGLEARRHALVTLEALRHAGISVRQGIQHDRMGEQMAEARQLGVPFLLIMGHKEAMEHTMLVREVASNSQRSIPLDELPGYLKRQRARV